MRWVATSLACIAVFAGCGGDGDNDRTAAPTVSTPATTTTETPPSGPIVRICDRRLARAVTAALQAQGVRGHLGSEPIPSGNASLSVCELAGAGAEVSISLDAASGAVRRYHNRVTETAQFSGGDPEHAPQTVKGVGDPRLGGAGANWLPRIHLLLSARGDRVLIVDVSADSVPDSRLLPAAKAISLAAYDRLGRGR
jgi:hypothetical protein